MKEDNADTAQKNEDDDIKQGGIHPLGFVNTFITRDDMLGLYKLRLELCGLRNLMARLSPSFPEFGVLSNACRDMGERATDLFDRLRFRYNQAAMETLNKDKKSKKRKSGITVDCEGGSDD